MTAKILIVDDDANNAALLAKLVSARWSSTVTGHTLEIVTVGTMKEALQEAPEAHATVLDLSLPDSNSEETIQQIKNFKPPVIVLTGFDDARLMTRCKEGGAQHVYVKGAIVGLIPDLFDAVFQEILRRPESYAPTT